MLNKENIINNTSNINNMYITANEPLKSRYGVVNYILISLVGLVVLLRLWAIISALLLFVNNSAHLFSTANGLLIFMGIIDVVMISIFVWTIAGMLKYKNSAYGTLIAFGIISLFQYSRGTNVSVLGVVLTFLITVIAIFLLLKLFPKDSGKKRLNDVGILISVSGLMVAVGSYGVISKNSLLELALPATLIFIGAFIVWMVKNNINFKNKKSSIFVGILFSFIGLMIIYNMVFHPTVFSKNLVSIGNDTFTSDISVPDDMNDCYTGCNINFSFGDVSFFRQKEGANILITGPDVNISKNLSLDVFNATNASHRSDPNYFDEVKDVIDTKFIVKKGEQYSIRVKVPAQSVNINLVK